MTTHACETSPAGDASSRDPATRDGQRGFTLVELLVVVVILGVIAVIAEGNTGNMGEYRLDMLEVQVEDAKDLAQALARSTREAHGVVFETETERLAIVGEDGELAVDPLTRDGYLVDFQAPHQPNGLDLVSAAFSDSRHCLIFDPQGVPLTGGDLVIASEDAVRTLSFDPATGDMTSDGP